MHILKYSFLVLFASFFSLIFGAAVYSLAAGKLAATYILFISCSITFIMMMISGEFRLAIRRLGKENSINNVMPIPPGWKWLLPTSGLIALHTVLVISLKNKGVSAVAMNFDNSQIDLLAIVYFIILAPVVEEVVYRNFLFDYIRRKINMAGGIIISAFVFSLSHMDGCLLISHFVFGVLMAYLFWITESVVVCILAHSFFNFVILIMQLLNIVVPLAGLELIGLVAWMFFAIAKNCEKAPLCVDKIGSYK